MLTIEIKVTGPGETLPMNLIREALETTGATVVVEDDHPKDPAATDGKYAGWTFKLVAQHCPWGG